MPRLGGHHDCVTDKPTKPNRHLRLVLDGQERERSNLAHQLHDQLAQSLAVVLMGLDELERRADAADAQRLASLREQLADALSLCTELAAGLRPSVLDELGLAPALESLAQRGRATHVSVDPSLAAARLERDLEIEVFRAAEEALAAMGPGCSLGASLQSGGCEACVSVSSTGAPLAPDALETLEARLELIGGTLARSSQALTIRIPVRRASRPVAAFPQPRRVETTDGERSALP